MAGNVSKSKHIVGHGLEIKGLVSSIDYLPNGANIGDVFQVGTDEQELYLWDGESWKYLGNYRGMQGPKGDKGDTGAQGIQGIQGEKGDRGNDGYTPIKGVDYFTEEDIKSLGIDDKVDTNIFNQYIDDLYQITGEKVDKETGKGLSSNDFTDVLKTRLENNTFDGYYVADYNEETGEYEFNFDKFSVEGVFLLYEPQSSDDVLYTYYILAVNTTGYESDTSQLLINLRNGEITQRSNYGDWQKISVSQTDLNKKVDKVKGKGLSSNDFTDTMKERLLNNTFAAFIKQEDNAQIDYQALTEMNIPYGISIVYAGNGDSWYEDYALVIKNILEDDEHLTVIMANGEIHTNFLDWDNGDGGDGTWQGWTTPYATPTDLNNAIGDIETSLENIIQKYGLGGDAQ